MSATGSRTGVEHLSLNLDVALLENEVLAAEDPLPDVVHVVNDSLEVRGRVVRACDEDVIRLARGRRGVQRRDRDELLVDGAEKREARLDLLLGPVGFDDCGVPGQKRPYSGFQSEYEADRGAVHHGTEGVPVG